MFPQLALAQVIELASKLDSLQVLQEAWLAPTTYVTLRRRLPTRTYAETQRRSKVLAISRADL